MTERAHAKTIWILDDDASIVEVWSRVLGSVGYRVVSFADPLQALSWFSIHAAEIDMAILDVMMPGLDGDQCLANVRMTRPDLPVMVITGYADCALVDEMKRKGVSAVISKPFDSGAFLKQVALLADKGCADGNQEPAKTFRSGKPKSVES